MTDMTIIPEGERDSTSNRIVADSAIVRRFRVSSPYPPRRSRPAEPQTDYTEFKALLETSVLELQHEMRAQHEQTRAEVRNSRADILKAIRTSPAEYIQLMCELSMAIFAFSLILRYLFSIEIVRTPFAIFMLFSLAIYWLMARVKFAQSRRPDSPEKS
jgi:hypothetical protein